MLLLFIFLLSLQESSPCLKKRMFSIEAEDGEARAGFLDLPHGKIETPAFMAVATQGAVKALLSKDIEEMGYNLILSNAFYLFLRPGPELFRRKKIHEFISWQGNILTDSGGYQIFNLAPLFEIEERGIKFRSPYDGTPLFLTPEDIISFQELMEVDVMMVLDHCVAYPASRKEAEQALARTTSWAERSYACWKKKRALFGIIQGGTDKNLRKKSAQEIIAIPFSGYAIGGLSVGEPRELFQEVLNFTAPLLPQEKPRYLMGLGKPEDILEAVKKGVDLFDCILPTRLGRSGTAFTSCGKIVIKNAMYQEDDAPLDPACACYTCTRFSRAYLRHLYRCQEISLMILVTLHNLFFYKKLMEKIRKAILKKCLTSLTLESLWENF